MCTFVYVQTGRNLLVNQDFDKLFLYYRYAIQHYIVPETVLFGGKCLLTLVASSAKRLRSPSVCPSVCLSVCLSRVPIAMAVPGCRSISVEDLCQRAAAASVLHCDPIDEDRRRLVSIAW